jgi:histidyl-tRNA synthetase
LLRKTKNFGKKGEIFMIQKPKGTRDILPSESYKWQYVEKTVSNLL